MLILSSDDSYDKMIELWKKAPDHSSTKTGDQENEEKFAKLFDLPKGEELATSALIRMLLF